MDRHALRIAMSDALYEYADEQSDHDFDIRDLREMGFMGDPFGLHMTVNGKRFVVEIKEDPRSVV